MKSFWHRRTLFLVLQLFSSSALWFALLLLFLPTQLGLHFWPDFTHVLGLRIDYLSPTLYFTDILIFLLLITWVREKFFTERGRSAGVGYLTGFDSTLFRSAKNLLRLILNTKYLILYTFILFVALNILSAQVPILALLKWLRFLELTLLFLYITRHSELVSESPVNNKIPDQVRNDARALIPLSVSVIFISTIAIIQFLLQSSLGGPFWLLGERTFTAVTPAIAKVNLCLPIIENWSLKIDHCRMALRPYSIFSHPNSLAGFLLVAIIFLSSLRGAIPHFLQIIWRRGNPVRNCSQLLPVSCYWFIVALATIALTLTFSRTAWLAAVVVLILWLIPKYLPFLKKYLIQNTTYFILFLSILSPFALSHLSSSAIFPSVSIEYRLALFQAAQSIITQHPLLGIGLNNFIPALPQHLPAPPTLSLLQPVHNIFWLILSETGLLGLSFALWGLFATLKRITTNQLPTSFSLILVAVLITGATDHYWLTLPQNQLLLTVILGLIWNQPRKMIPNSRPKTEY
jgi:hypothetical protein